MDKNRALNLLKENYFKLESPIAFANEDILYEYFKDWLSREDLKKFLQSLPEYTKQRKFVHKFKRNYTYAPRRRYLMQADLKDIGELKRSNYGKKFILCVIDCFSRKLFARLIKNKSEQTVHDAFNSILQETGFFNHLCTDRG